MPTPGTTGVSGGFNATQLTALLNEMQNDPRHLGYAAYIPGGSVNPDANNLAILLNCLRDGATTPYDNTGKALSIGPSGTITGATNASPIVVTSANHGLAVGDSVVISGVLGNTAANGTWIVSAVTTNTFTLTAVAGGGASTGNGAYTSGGTWTWCVDAFSTGSQIPSAGATAFQILGAFAKADLAAATPTTAECSWFNALASVFPNSNSTVPLLTSAGAENNIIGCLKGFIGSAQTTSINNLTALKYRFGSRAEQILNLAGTSAPAAGSPGNVLTAIDVQAAFAGGY